MASSEGRHVRLGLRCGGGAVFLVCEQDDGQRGRNTSNARPQSSEPAASNDKVLYSPLKQAVNGGPASAGPWGSASLVHKRARKGELALRNGVGGRQRDPPKRASHVNAVLTRTETKIKNSADSPKRTVPSICSSIGSSGKMSLSRVGPPSLQVMLLQQRTQ